MPESVYTFISRYVDNSFMESALLDACLPCLNPHEESCTCIQIRAIRCSMRDIINVLDMVQKGGGEKV